MAQKSATVTLDKGELQFHVRFGRGHEITLDNTEGNTGPTPAELIPASVAGCTAMDVISILRKKRQEVTHYEVRATGAQMEASPHAFLVLDIVHHVEGPTVDDEAVRRAIELSAEKYCSVGSTLGSGVTEVRHSYSVKDATGERSAHVITIGPLDPAVASAAAEARSETVGG